jgi:hypothetical protein
MGVRTRHITNNSSHKRFQTLRYGRQPQTEAVLFAFDALELANGILTITSEKRSETEDKDRVFSERYYGRFERRIPVEEVDEDKVSATFKQGVLTVTMPKSPQAKSKAKHIAINGR